MAATAWYMSVSVRLLPSSFSARSRRRAHFLAPPASQSPSDLHGTSYHHSARHCAIDPIFSIHVISSFSDFSWRRRHFLAPPALHSPLDLPGTIITISLC